MTSAALASNGRRRKWTSDELDEVESYIAIGLSAVEIAKLISPPTTSNAIRCAMSRAGISLAQTVDGRNARPTKVEQERRRRCMEQILSARNHT